MEDENKNADFKIGKSVETYADDMVKAIAGDKGGLIKKIIHEEEEHEALKKKVSPLTRENRLFMLVSVLFLALGFAVLIFVFLAKGRDDGTVAVSPQAASMIFTDKTDFKAVDGFNREKVEEAVLSLTRSAKVKVGGVAGIYLTEGGKVVGFRRFMELIKGDLSFGSEPLFNDHFLMGAVNKHILPTDASFSSLNRGFFMLLKVRSFGDAFLPLRNWENKMLYDLHNFFGVDISPNTSGFFTKDFEDGIVGNKNARILKDQNGKIILMYVFVNDYFVIVTNSEAVTEEIILRLFTSQVKK